MTTCVLDTCVINWLVDGKIKQDSLPGDGKFAVTQIQFDELNKTSNEERRARLFLTQNALHCELLLTETFLFGTSRLGHGRLGHGMCFTRLKADLDAGNGSKANNHRDALIAEVAIVNGFTLITTDQHLRELPRDRMGRSFPFPLLLVDLYLSHANFPFTLILTVSCRAGIKYRRSTLTAGSGNCKSSSARAAARTSEKANHKGGLATDERRRTICSAGTVAASPCTLDAAFRTRN